MFKGEMIPLIQTEPERKSTAAVIAEQQDFLRARGVEIRQQWEKNPRSYLGWLQTEAPYEIGVVLGGHTETFINGAIGQAKKWVEESDEAKANDQSDRLDLAA